MIVEQLGQDQMQLVFRRYEEQGYEKNVYIGFLMLIGAILGFLLLMILLMLFVLPLVSVDFALYKIQYSLILVGIFIAFAIPFMMVVGHTATMNKIKVLLIDGLGSVVKLQQGMSKEHVKTMMEIPFASIQAVDVVTQVSGPYFLAINIRSDLVPGELACLLGFRPRWGTASPEQQARIAKIIKPIIDERNLGVIPESRRQALNQQAKITALLKSFIDDMKRIFITRASGIHFREQYINTTHVYTESSRSPTHKDPASTRPTTVGLSFYIALIILLSIYLFYSGASLISFGIMALLAICGACILSCVLVFYGDPIKQARTAFRSGKIIEAMQTYKHIVAHHPANGVAWRDLATAFTAMNDLGEAIFSWEKVLQLDPRSPSALLNLAMAWGKMGNSEHAIPFFKQILVNSPRDPLAWHEYLRFLGENNDIAGMLDGNKRAIATMPADPYLKINFGLFSALSGDFKKARDLFEEALQLLPSHEYLRCILCITLDELGQVDLAFQNLQDVIRVNPKSLLAWYLMAMTFIKKRDLASAKEARTRYQELLASNPLGIVAGFDFLILVIHLLIGKGLLDEANDFCDVLSKIMPDEEKVKRIDFPRALLNKALGKFQLTNEYYENSIHADFFSFSMLGDYVEFLVLQGQVKRVQALLDEKLRLFSKSDGLHQLAGCFYMSQHDVERAIINFNEAARLNRENWKARLRLGACNLFKENIIAAVDNIAGILKDNPDYMPAKIMLNMARVMQENASEKKDQDSVELTNQYSMLELLQFDEVISLFDFLGARDQGLIAARTCSELYPFSEKSWLYLGNQHSHANSWDAAIIAFKKAVEINPQGIDGLLNLGHALCRKQLIDDAKNILVPFVEKYPLVMTGWIHLARMHLSLIEPDLDQALNALDHARALNPNDPALTYGYAVYHACGGNHEKALEFLQQAISMNKTCKIEAKNDELLKPLFDEELFQRLTQ